MSSSFKFRRRLFGALCLAGAIVMLVIGEMTPGKRLEGIGFITYWLGCFVLAALALLTAILDARALRREASEEQRALLEGAWEAIQEEKAQKSKTKSPSLDHRSGSK